nr:cytokine-like protein 1 [Odocoileus virginianus texanus]
MTPQLFPLLLLLLLAGLPATRPAPPTCYSRMLALSREITSDFQSLQATEPLDLVFLSDDCNALEYPILVTTVLPDHQS